MNKKKQLLLNLALTVFFVAAVIVRGPNLNPLYSDGAFAWCFAISCYVVLNFFICLGSLRISTNEYNRMQFSIDSSVKSVKKHPRDPEGTRQAGVGSSLRALRIL